MAIKRAKIFKIAAQAVARELTLVSNSEREFKRVAGLRLENWAAV